MFVSRSELDVLLCIARVCTPVYHNQLETTFFPLCFSHLNLQLLHRPNRGKHGCKDHKDTSTTNFQTFVHFFEHTDVRIKALLPFISKITTSSKGALKYSQHAQYGGLPERRIYEEDEVGRGPALLERRAFDRSSSCTV